MKTGRLNFKIEAPLFVYGTLMQGFENPIRNEFLQGSRFVGEGSVLGRLFKVSYYPAAFPSSNSMEVVHGEIYQIRDPNLWSLLDHYEGVDQSPPCEYVRSMTSLVRSNNPALSRVWIYWYNWSLNPDQLLPSGRFASNSGRPSMNDRKP